MLRVYLIDSSNWSYLGVNFSDDISELLEIDDTISIFVCVIDHLVHFGSWKTLSHAGSSSFELFWTEGTLSGGVKGFEKLLKGLLTVSTVIKSENIKEGLEIDVTWVVWAVDNI